ncbi:MAG TPA: DoxX family protein [Longimicrobium sp.]|nr:DoxX family protein [Longimicrobium sp.]
MTTQAIDPHTFPAATTTRSASRVWTGRIVSAIPILFLLMDGAMKLANPAPVREAMVNLGWPAGLAPTLGVILLSCVVIHLIPRTAVLGAILLSAYLGGAVATHMRIGEPLFNQFFAVIVALLVWGGLYLRDARVRALFT